MSTARARPSRRSPSAPRTPAASSSSALRCALLLLLLLLLYAAFSSLTVSSQVLYRLGRYTESAETYKTMDSDSVDPAELAVNRAAALCAAGDATTAEKVITATAQIVEMTPDMAYNKACCVIERGDWKQALEAVDEAEKQFVASAEEDGDSEEAIADGKIVFAVQRAYVKQRMGHNDAALEG